MARKIIKIRIRRDEWFPVYTFSKEYGIEIKIEKKEYKRMKKIIDKFEKTQEVLDKLIK